MRDKAARFLPKNIATKISARKLADSEAEERLYELVRQEYESGVIRSGLWTKAEATAKSTEEAEIRGTYFKFRFEQLEAQSNLQRLGSNGEEKFVLGETLQGSETVRKSKGGVSTPIDSATVEIGQEEKKDGDIILIYIVLVVIFLLLLVNFML